MNHAPRSLKAIIAGFFGFWRIRPEAPPQDAGGSPPSHLRDLEDEEFIRWRSETINKLCGGPPIYTTDDLRKKIAVRPPSSS